MENVSDYEILKLVLFLVIHPEVKPNMVAYSLISLLKNNSSDFNDLLKVLGRSDYPRSERILNKIIMEKFHKNTS